MLIDAVVRSKRFAGSRSGIRISSAGYDTGRVHHSRVRRRRDARRNTAFVSRQGREGMVPQTLALPEPSASFLLLKQWIFLPGCKSLGGHSVAVD